MPDYHGYIDDFGGIHISGGYDGGDVETNPYIILLQKGASDREIQLTYERDLKQAEQSYEAAVRSKNVNGVTDELSVLQAKRRNASAISSAQNEIDRIRKEYREYVKKNEKYVPYSIDTKYEYHKFRLWGGLIGAAILLLLGFWGYDWNGPSNFFMGISGIIFFPIMGAVPGVIIGAIACAILKANAKSKYDAKRNA